MTDQTELRIEDQPPEFQKWLKEQDLEGRDKKMHNFHRWMRKHTDLGSGTRVEYRKKLHSLMREDGSLDVEKENLSTREKTAYNKYQAYLESDFSLKDDSVGDTSD